jgi:NDP-sugar pyrophosphorylase family protein
LAGAEVEEEARVVRSIVGSRALVGRGATLVDSVLGEGVRVPPGMKLEGVRLGPREEPS